MLDFEPNFSHLWKSLIFVSFWEIFKTLELWVGLQNFQCPSRSRYYAGFNKSLYLYLFCEVFEKHHFLVILPGFTKLSDFRIFSVILGSHWFSGQCGSFQEPRFRCSLAGFLKSFGFTVICRLFRSHWICCRFAVISKTSDFWINFPVFTNCLISRSFSDFSRDH